MNYTSMLTKRVYFELGDSNPLVKKAKSYLYLCSEILDRNDVIEKVMKNIQISFLNGEKRLIEIDRDLKATVKYNEHFNVGKAEEQVYQAAMAVGKKHLVTPAKFITVPYLDKDIALQLYLDGSEFIFLNDCLKSESYQENFKIEKIAEAVLFEFIFGITILQENDLIFNKLNGDIIHTSNEYSWKVFNEMREDDDWTLPFTSPLLGFKTAHEPLSFEQFSYIKEEIDNYFLKLEALKKILIDDNENHENILNSLSERLNRIQKSLKISTESFNHTLADIVLSASVDYKKIIYLKLALLVLNRVREDSSFNSSSSLSFIQEIKRNVFQANCEFGDYYPDLISELDDNEPLKDAIINKIEEFFEMSLNEFIFEISFFLIACSENEKQDQVPSQSTQQDGCLLPLDSIV